METAKQRYRRKQREAGKCRECSEPAAWGRKMCEYHLLLALARSKARYEVSKAEVAAANKDLRYRRRMAGECTRCGNPVTDGKRTCSEHHGPG